MKHFRNWGAVYILAVLFAASWLGQLISMSNKIIEEGWSEFWSATMENWQSEFLQLGVQAILISAFAGRLFKISKKDTERIEAKIDTLMRNRGVD